MMTRCAQCGKLICIHWPEHWVYKRRDLFLCSEDCMVVFDTQEYRKRTGWIKDYYIKKKGKKNMNKLTQAQKNRAVQIAIDGGNPLPFLKECGSEKPEAMWWAIKNNVKKNDPERFEMIPKRVNLKKQVETPEGEFVATVKVDGPLNIETPEPEKVTVAKIQSKVVDIMDELKIKNPLKYEGFSVREIEGEFGRYRHSKTSSGDYIDYENKDGLEILSMTVDQWRGFLAELQRAALVLGVEL